VNECAICNKPILPTENKVTIQGVAYHSRCWDRRQAKASKKP
jgi:hypothetical protein